MIPSTLFALVTALSSVVAVNGAIIQRDGSGSVSFQTPQPTVSSHAMSSAPVTSGSVLTSKFPSSAPMSSAVTSPATTTSPVPTTSPATVKSPTATTTSVVRATTCDGVQQWQSAFGYSAGDKAIFNNQLYVAKQWTWNNAPPTHPDQWTGQGACTPPIVNSANCAGVLAWNKDTAYVTGNQVTFNGHLWIAVQWTQSNSPGDASGIWRDEGACTVS
ncbi:hypothetical protein JVU11DRAFT_7815 [Chiua virens]|nr:hypothetical protein JVU11DRAFT_7815 [Chiua virens]